MQPQTDIDTSPRMAAIGNRPATVVQQLHSMDGTYVQCRLPDGVDAHVPMREIFRLFEKELVNKARIGVRE